MNAQETEKVITFSKGTWHTGLTLSINNEQDDNIDALLLNIVENEKEGFEIDVLGGYFFTDDMSFGFRYSYLKRERNLVYESNGANARLQSARAKNNFTTFLRNYYPISANNRFNFFNETDLGIGFGNSNVRKTKNPDDITKTFTDEFNMNLGVRPGIAIILAKGFAFEMGIDLLGLTYTNTSIRTDGIEKGASSDFSFDFDISLLSLDFGIAYYF